MATIKNKEKITTKAGSSRAHWFFVSEKKEQINESSTKMIKLYGFSVTYKIMSIKSYRKTMFFPTRLKLLTKSKKREQIKQTNADIENINNLLLLNDNNCLL